MCLLKPKVKKNIHTFRCICTRFSKFFVLLLAMLAPTFVLAQNIVQVSDGDIQPGQHVTWTSENIYMLNGFVFVDSTASLTIEAGTVIKGKPGQGETASALIVARGGKIFANGTATRPIIFTAEADDVSDPFDLPPDVRGLWGGLIILGTARLNSTPGQTAIEGIPTTEKRGLYGGNDDDDNSGVLRYVSVRYGGTDIGAGNEINGVTFGGVGRGTTVEFVEVFNNADDGFEFFGGTVQTRYLISAFNGDDCFDYDEGFRGKGQFWFALQSDEIGNRAGEHDGGTEPEDGQPYAIPQIYNATYIGSGIASANAENDLALIFRDNAGGKYYNSIFTDFEGKAIKVEDLESGQDSQARMQAGDLVLANNIWWGFGAGSNPEDFITQDFVLNHLTSHNNRITDPKLMNTSRTNDAGLLPLPSIDSPAWTDVAPVPDDGFFVQTDYIGAFGKVNWLTDWTYIAAAGIVSSEYGGHPTTRVETRASSGTLPEGYQLDQNYPNPFNPQTSISYSLPKDAHVRLDVYNQLGQMVATLVNGERKAGTYTATWNASALPSGLYFCRLQSREVNLSIKMMLIE